MIKVNHLIDFLRNRGLHKQSQDLSEMFSMFSEKEPSFIEELCNRDIIVTLDIFREAIREKKGVKFNEYTAKVNNPFFKNMEISFNDQFLRYLDKNNYYTLEFPDYRKMSEDEYYAKQDKYHKRVEYLEKKIKELPPAETKKIIVDRVKEMIVDFLIKFQLFLCSTRNKDIISEDELIYANMITEFLERKLDIDINYSYKSSSIHDAGEDYTGFIDLNHEWLNSPEEAEEVMNSFISTLYHEIAHPFSEKFEWRAYGEIKAPFQYKEEGFYMSFPKYKHVQTKFYKEFFDKFYNLEISSLKVDKNVWSQLSRYIFDDTYYNQLFDANFEPIEYTKERHELFVDEENIACYLDKSNCREIPTFLERKKSYRKNMMQRLPPPSTTH